MRTRVRKQTDEQQPEHQSDELQVDSLTVHYPEELYAPVQYHSFRVGGHSVTITPRAGESVAQAFERGYKLLEELADKEFQHRLAKFRERLNQTRD